MWGWLSDVEVAGSVVGGERSKVMQGFPEVEASRIEKGKSGASV